MHLHSNWLKKYVITILSIFLLFFGKSAYAFNSLLDFENAAQGKKGFSYLTTMNDCFSTGKAIYVWEYGDFNNVEIETVIGTNTQRKSSSAVANVFMVGATRAAVYATLIANPLTSLFAVLAIGIDYLHMVETCSNAFIVAPHEYYNIMSRGDTCAYNYNADGKRQYYFTNPNKTPPLTWDDVPFFYHCNPNYDPTVGSALVPGGSNANLIGKTWGYMGSASHYCSPDRKKYIDESLVGTAVVSSFSGAKRFAGYEPCVSFKDNLNFVKAGDQKTDGNYVYYGYYRFDSRAGNLQLCVAHPYSILPVRIGCTTVPPPNEEIELDPAIVALMEKTTCGYFFTGRTDLKSLGEALSPIDANGKEKQYIKDFLMSELHLTSTVVNCIKDQLARMIVNPSLSLAGADSKSYFEVVQIRFRQIAFAALVLYVSIVGMMLITSPQEPRRGEMIMWLIKFALVVYFIFLEAWYTVENGRKEGLYAGLIYGTDSVANVFLNAQASYNPNDYCNYKFQGDNLIQERKIIPASVGGAVETTRGYDYLKMSIWDLVDCKVANYLNYGTCNYSITNMVGLWLFKLAFVSSGLGIVLSIVAFLYLFLFLLIIFKFTHTVLLAAFVITILIFISPVTIVCALFKPTATIFQQWMRALIGYFLYPALLFAFLALIMATLDLVYYGRLDYKPGAPPIAKQCENIESIYCAIVKASSQTDPCKTNIQTDISYDTKLWGFIPVKAVKPEYVTTILLGLAKSLLFVVIFYFYMGVLDDMISIVMGIHGLGRIAKGSLNMVNMALAGMSKIGSVVSGLIGAGKSAGSKPKPKPKPEVKLDTKKTPPKPLPKPPSRN